MDVSSILASQSAKFQSTTVEKEIPLKVDAGLLTVTDVNPIDEESYNTDLEEHLRSLARDGVQALFATLFSLPFVHSADGPLAQLPPPVYQLPRAKPLPKPKPLTKWEAFAAAKGIRKKVRDKKVWDEEKQEWANRWGRGGKNKEKEVQWLSEVPLDADIDYDPRKVARDERKARMAKNEKKQAQNLDRAGGKERKQEIGKTLATARISTASLGRFDKRLEGEKKIRGVKRKFDPTEMSVEQEKKASLALISRMESDSKKTRKGTVGVKKVLNVRKAIRLTNKGRGAVGPSRTSSRGGGRGNGSKS